MSALYSQEHRLCFIHVPKTAGTTISTAILVAINGGEPDPEFRFKGFGAHPVAVKVRGRLGPREWRRCWTFGLVRNPWDRLVSLYSFNKLRENIRSGLSFRDWLLSKSGAHKKTVPQSHWLFDGERRIVDDVFRFERLDETRHALSRHLEQQIRFDHWKPTQRPDYQDAYDAETRAWVARAYAEDIERFGYAF